MINVFNSPIEASTLDEFHEGKDRTEDAVFQEARKRPVVSYNADGRKIVDGTVEHEQSPNNLWSTAITRGAANEWREKAGGGRLHRAKRSVANFAYDCRIFLNQSSRRYATQLLVIVNLSLMLIFLYLFKLTF